MKKDNVLVYGSLRKGGHNNAWLKYAKFVKEVIVRGLKIYDGGGFPYAVHTGNDSDHVLCEQYEVSNIDISDLDRLEGIDATNSENGHYFRRRVGGETGPWIYMTTQKEVDEMGIPEVPLKKVVCEKMSTTCDTKGEFQDWLFYLKNRKHFSTLLNFDQMLNSVNDEQMQALFEFSKQHFSKKGTPIRVAYEPWKKSVLQSWVDNELSCEEISRTYRVEFDMDKVNLNVGKNAHLGDDELFEENLYIELCDSPTSELLLCINELSQIDEITNEDAIRFNCACQVIWDRIDERPLTDEFFSGELGMARVSALLKLCESYGDDIDANAALSIYANAFSKGYLMTVEQCDLD